tara:strand:- start:16701 stop:18125 length:1425 start_codon:yes stop_codon:yes gene_type:complete
MITWGISSNSHNAALAVFSNDSLMFASESERFSRVKNDPVLNDDLISHGLKWGKPDLICWYENPLRKRWRQIKAGQGPFIDNFTKYFNCKHKFIDHHYSHACAGYYTSKFNNCAILVIDAIGEFQTLSIWKAIGNRIYLLYELKYPNSIGLWYSAMTQRIGLKPNEEEYILMALSSFGDRDKLTSKMLNELIGIDFISKRNLHRGCMDWQPDATDVDIAAATQHVYEVLFSEVLRKAKTLTGSDNLVFMGGCALNCAANGLAYDYFKNVWIMPAPGDAGSAIGAVLAHKKKKIKFSPYLGYKILHHHSNNSIVDYLKDHKICGLARGRAEFGPRALGARSLLADPTSPGIKDRVNEIKKRQEFRPFSPVVPLEYASKYFDMHNDMVESPFMQYAVKCKAPNLLSGVIHVDGTSRVQTVKKSDAPRLHDLLMRWGKETGVPVLLNTSLNIKGEPIVNDETDANRWSSKHGVKVFS